LTENKPFEKSLDGKRVGEKERFKQGFFESNTPSWFYLPIWGSQLAWMGLFLGLN
jgi:hypothetical protein